MNKTTEIVASRRSRVFGPLLILTALATMGLGIWSVSTQSTAIFSNRLIEVSFPLMMAWLLWEGGRMLAARRGGMDRVDSDLLLYGESGADAIRVPLAQIDNIAVHCVRELWGDLIHDVWVCEALLKDGLRVILAQSDDEHALKHMANQICEKLEREGPIVYEDEPPPCPAYSGALGTAPKGVAHTADAMILSVGASGVLNRTLIAGGLVSVVVGTLLLMDVGNNGALGFMFGPFLGVMGVVLLAIPLTNSVLLEHIKLSPDGTISHHRSALGWHWGLQERTLHPGWYLRIRQRGVHGGCLEILSGGRILEFCGGVHARSRIKPDDLLWVARFVRSQAAVEVDDTQSSESEDQEPS